MKYYGRMFFKPNTTYRFTNENEVTAPDEYIRLFMKCDNVGAVTFIEIATSLKGPWQLWRSEIVNVHPVILLTARCDEQSARKELVENGFQFP